MSWKKTDSIETFEGILKQKTKVQLGIYFVKGVTNAAEL